MNRKINTLCFIFLFLFLISAVSATDNENETLKTITSSCAEQNNICKESNEKEFQASNVEDSNPVLQSTLKKQKVTLSVPNITMYYKDGHKFNVKLTNKNKKPIRNAIVKIKIAGTTYTRITDKKGTLTLDLNLKSGNYNAITIFDGTRLYKKAIAQSTVKIKSTIKCSDFTSFYRSPSSYTVKFSDKNGNTLKNSVVMFKINEITCRCKTNNNGIVKLYLNPGKFNVKIINLKTGESNVKTVTIKSPIKTNDLTMNEGDGSTFNVKISGFYGNSAANKKVTLKLNGKTYTRTTNKTGQISLPIDLNAGTYSITTEFNKIKAVNKITVNKVITSFKHVTSIPNYVNVTIPYVYYNAKYSIKLGVNGTVKMPKIESFNVEIGSKNYLLSTGKTGIENNLIMGYKSYLIPFNGGAISCCANKDSISLDGIMITRFATHTEIEYRSKTTDNIELFGFYADKGLENSEILTYAQNDKIVGKISIQTLYFDETGVKYSLAKHYKRTNADFGYYEITNHIKNPIIFTNTQIPVTYSYFGNNIVGYSSKELINTRFIVNGKEELEKPEIISYGLSKKYRRAYGFEVLQAFTIINEKVKQNTVENWISENPNYINRFGMMNLYGMHLASLETTWLADELADKYAKEFNVNWIRGDSLTILGGINLEDTYLNILNADMGMTVKGNEKNVILFRLLNSMNLPNIEEYALSPVSERYMDNTTNSLDNILLAIKENKFSITQLGDLIYVFSQDNSTIILNITNGVASVIHFKNNSTYKGSSITTSRDCCSVGILPKDIIAGIRNSMKIFAPGIYLLSDELNKIHPLSVLGYMGIKFVLEKTLEGASSACIGLLSTMTIIQTGGTMYRNNMVNEKEWHKVMDTLTFTRPGYLQGKKVYNIPNNRGYDYVEVKINDDLTLDRNNALYISNGKTKKLTEKETYQYFCDDYWTPFSMPEKYWDKSWSGK